MSLVSQFVILAWEINLDKNYFLFQSHMAKQEMCLTERYNVNKEEIENKTCSWVPKMKVQPLSLRECSCSTVSLKPNKNTVQAKIYEIATFNPTSLLIYIKKEIKTHNLTNQLVIGRIFPQQNKIKFLFYSKKEENQDEKEKIEFFNCFKQIGNGEKNSFLKFFNENTVPFPNVGLYKEKLQTLKASYEMLLVNRNLYVPVFIYPYFFVNQPEYKSHPEKNCFVCSMIHQPSSSIKFEMQREKISRWETKYIEEKQNFPLSPVVVEAIKHTKNQLEKHTQVEGLNQMICPNFSSDSSFISCEFLLPGLKQCLRDLELLSSFADIIFTQGGIYFLCDGNMGINKCGFQSMQGKKRNICFPYHHIRFI